MRERARERDSIRIDIKLHAFHFIRIARLVQDGARTHLYTRLRRSYHVWPRHFCGCLLFSPPSCSLREVMRTFISTTIFQNASHIKENGRTSYRTVENIENDSRAKLKSFRNVLIHCPLIGMFYLFRDKVFKTIVVKFHSEFSWKFVVFDFSAHVDLGFLIQIIWIQSINRNTPTPYQ